MCTGILRPVCARAVPRRACAACAGLGLMASPAAWGRRPALPFSAAPCSTPPLRLARRHVSRMQCVAGARRARAGAATVLGCGLAAAAAQTGDAAENMNDEWKTAGSPPLRPWSTALWMAWPDAHCGGSPASDRAGPTARRCRRRGMRCAPALPADKTTLRGGAESRGASGARAPRTVVHVALRCAPASPRGGSAWCPNDRRPYAVRQATVAGRLWAPHCRAAAGCSAARVRRPMGCLASCLPPP